MPELASEICPAYATPLIPLRTSISLRNFPNCIEYTINTLLVAMEFSQQMRHKLNNKVYIPCLNLTHTHTHVEAFQKYVNLHVRI